MIKPGSSVHFWRDGWRTGVFLGIVEHTKSSNGNFGLYRIRPNFLDTEVVLCRPEEVKLIEKKAEVTNADLADLLR